MEEMNTTVEEVEIETTETTTETIVITEDSFGDADWEQLNSLFAEQNALLAEQQEALNHIYTGQVFTLGVMVPVLVCLLLYKFLKLFV